MSQQFLDFMFSPYNGSRKYELNTSWKWEEFICCFKKLVEETYIQQFQKKYHGKYERNLKMLEDFSKGNNLSEISRKYNIHRSSVIHVFESMRRRAKTNYSLNDVNPKEFYLFQMLEQR